MKPLQQQRRSLLHYIKRDRMATATFLIPTQMTRTQFLEHDLLKEQGAVIVSLHVVRQIQKRFFCFSLFSSMLS